MKKKVFQCTLCSDVILHQKAATEGNQECLDFIPGSNFLGIVAGELYKKLKPEESLHLFHSGKVMFGDAHPMISKNAQQGIRTIRIPASMHSPKSKDANELCYIHHAYEREKDLEKQQLKQCRKGFYAFENEKGIPANIDKSFAIKSAYDRDMRRSADEQMYAYQSLQEGSTWLFEVYADTDDYLEEIKKTLENGKKRVGRSRTAQYGLVEMKEHTEKLVEPVISKEHRNYVLVYADARLIFLDDYGLPTFQPTVEQLGFPGGTIMWEKSQIRTFQYAPWNFTRQARDTDRCGIEKGSVFYIKPSDNFTHSGEGVAFVGQYKNEGFGKVLINPEFLNSKPGTNGEAKYSIEKIKEVTSATVLFNKDVKKSSVYKYLHIQKEKEQSTAKVYDLVNSFVTANGRVFNMEKFASQWGCIRNLAMQYSGKKEDRHRAIIEYITHGVAKWDNSKIKSLEKFIEDINNLGDEYSQLALINLSSEMAKDNRRK